jgi:hypothetical protein
LRQSACKLRSLMVSAFRIRRPQLEASPRRSVADGIALSGTSHSFPSFTI